VPARVPRITLRHRSIEITGATGRRHRGPPRPLSCRGTSYASCWNSTPGSWTFAEVRSEPGEHQKHAFEELRGLLALHATAEGLVMRSATKRAGDGQGSEVAGARN
jgi:hypothetical protein